MFEGISMAKDIHTLDDLDAFMKSELKVVYGGDKKQTGAFLREMGTMFTHSVLSGPKTAVRAVLGTSTATFTRPMAMALGGAMKGDFGTTMRAGFASLNAMREAIPESFELFKKNLNGYWAGDISTMKTRFVERTKLDDQWQMYGHWAETRGEM